MYAARFPKWKRRVARLRNWFRCHHHDPFISNCADRRASMHLTAAASTGRLSKLTGDLPPQSQLTNVPLPSAGRVAPAIRAPLPKPASTEMLDRPDRRYEPLKAHPDREGGQRHWKTCRASGSGRFRYVPPGAGAACHKWGAFWTIEWGWPGP